MSVKCGYSNKYYPLLMGIFSKDVSETKQEFKKFVNDTFLDPDSVYRKFMSGVDLSSTQTPIFEPKQISSRTGIEVKTDSNSAQQYYIGEARQYNKMANDFAKTIISLSVFNLDTETFVNPNQIVGDSSLLNKGILEYKKFLLNIISQYIGEPLSNLDSLSTVDLSDTFNHILSIFESVINHTTDHDASYYKAYNAYVTLKTFDSLLDELTPFVKVNQEYQKASLYSKQRYTYVGPNVQHYTGFSTNEYADIKDAVGDLAKILLKYFPEVNINGKIIDGTSISLSGFNSAMGKLKMWAEDSIDPEVQDELKKGTNMDVVKLIDKYEDALSTNKNILPEHITYLRTKLAGIKRFIYSPKMSQDIKNMFTHLMEKTVLSSYVSYSQIGENSPLEVKNLTERTVLMQSRFIDDVISAASTYWKTNNDKFKSLLEKHNITVLGDKIRIGEALISRAPTGAVSISGPVSNFEQIVSDIAQLVVADDFNSVAQQVHPNRELTDIQLYTPVLSTIIFNVTSGSESKINYGQGRDLAKVLSVINGSDTINVIKNSEGNNLPLYQMICLAYSHRNIFNEISQQLENNPDLQSPYYDNAIYQNIQHVKNPKIRSEVIVGKNIQTSAKLNESDVMHLAIVYDFYQNIVTKQSQSDTANSQVGIIGLQSHVYSDKNKHFIMQFDINKTWNFGRFGSFNFKTLLDQYFKTANTNDLNKIVDVWFNINKSQIESTLNIIFDDYEKATGQKFNNISELKTYLSKHKIDDIRKMFAASGVEFVDEIHASKIGKNWTVNETVENFANIFTDRTKFNTFISDQFNQFLTETEKAWETISRDKNLIESFKTLLPKFVNKNTLLKYSDGKINPLLYSYFVMDSFLTNEYNKMMVGNVYAHPNKNKEKPTAENYLQHSLAARWISQVKRMVIYGATYHSYAQGLKEGVPERVKMAVMPDIGSNVQNISGMSSVVDSMDGSGYTSPFLSRWQNISLIDAAVGANKKTIYHDIDARYGLPKLLKWAEYEITNALRRNSKDVSLEQLFKKMHDFKFSNEFSYSQTFDNLYFRDVDTGNYYKINQIIIKDGVATRKLSSVDKFGYELTGGLEDQFDADSIYNLDQIFGGAWSMELNSLTNDLQYSEKNLDYINKIICDQGLKDYMIGWLVNKSAIKVGTSNLNPKTSWFDDAPLLYTTMSTKFGGVQMNADHELDDAEVTEMTQMISGLEQNGFTHNIATRAYQEIGKFCYEAISKLQDIIYKGDKNELYKVFGKAIVKAFQTGTKDTLGLAQSFIKLAQKSFDDNNIDYRIPFSSASINGIFNSTVTSSLVRDAIRRHYNGVAAVLNPSYNVMQYYNVSGNNYRYEELIDLVKEVTEGTALEGLTVEEAINKVYVTDNNNNSVLNPFIVDITSEEPVDFEDTIVIFNQPNENGTYSRFGELTILPYEVVKIDNYESYDYYRHYEQRPMMRWSLKPRNLKGSDTTFVANGKKYSMFESPYTRVLHYFVEADLAANDLASLEDELRERVTEELKNITTNTEIINNVFKDRWGTILNTISPFLNGNKNANIGSMIPNIKKFLVKQQQKLLNNLSELKPLQWGNEVLTPESYHVIPAQIVMGKLYARQLGLLPGDSIAQIKRQGPQFFKERITGYYTEDNPNPFTYDWVLFDGTGNKLYVKLRTPQVTNLYDNSSPNSDYKTIEGDVYFNGEEICSADGKQFITYFDENGEQRNVVIIDAIDRLKELENSKVFSLTQRNYRLDNYKELALDEFGEGVSIQLNTRDANNRWTVKNIAELENAQQIVNALAENQDYIFERKIDRLAKAKFNSFEKSLKFVGTRIPCQSMQSFMPVEVVTFTDSETNEVFVPSNQTWLQGSDYDIDKSYILGYSVSGNGYISTDENAAPHLRADALRNRVVDNIFDVILNPKNQINLTMPITTDRMQKLAAKSQMGETAKIMSPYDPASKYLMQIQNMVGKAVIGNVATALKSFFALSNVYNTKFQQIYELIRNGQYDAAREMLNRYTFNHNGKLITLANVNVDLFNSLITQDKFGSLQINQNIPGDVREILASVISYEDALEDQSMLLGELLNAATDNAKELILKKINADTNWVDIYTVSFMLGDSLDDVGKLMLDGDITELVNNYNSSIFSKSQNTDKIKYIKDNIRKERTKSNPSDDKIRKYEELLAKAVSAEEVRILGKILKINQGLPTNTADTYRYIKSIEKFIELQYNKELQDAVDDSLNALIEAINNEEKSSVIKYLSESYNNAKINRDNRWERFDLIQFILNPEYKQEQINKYEQYKTNFNILEVIAEVPHFREMFKVLALNKQILNSLSVRNRLEDIIWNQVQHSSKKENGERSNNTNISKILDKEEIRDIKDQIDKHLINSWIISKNLAVTIPVKAYNNAVPEVLRLNSTQNIDKFRRYVEDYAIPTLKEKLPNNRFVSLLTFGLRQNIPFYKLPFNMVQVDNTQKTRSLYEEALYAFNSLKTVKVENIDMNLVDMFYLYNLIVNQDKFGPNSLTRIFEDLISAAGNENLLVYDFNAWIDRQNIQQLVDTFPLPNIKLNESTPVLEDNSIGFDIQPTDSDLEEAAIESGDSLENQDLASEWSKKEGWSIDYFDQKIKPRLNEAWQLEYEFSEDQESPVQLEGSAAFKYDGQQRQGILAKTAVDAIRLGERTAATYYESDRNIDYWRQAKVGDRIKFKDGQKSETINIFYGNNENSDLSNFAERPFKLNVEETDYYFNVHLLKHYDINKKVLLAPYSTYPTFKTVEGAFQALKLLYQDQLSEKEMNDLLIKLANASGAEARKLGRSIKGLNTNDWDRDSSVIMKELIKASFQQNPDALNKLLNTEDAVLTHTQDKSKWGDKFPKLLMEVRAELGGLSPESDHYVIVEVTKPLTKLVPESQLDLSANYYNTKPSTKSKLIALVKAANMKGLHLIYDADLVKEDPLIRNAKGFVRNGEIYINADRATDDTVIHEFGHLYLADAKLNHPNEYYSLLAKIRETPTWRAMRALPEYANKRGSDFDEEVLASMISGAEAYGGGSEYGLILEALDLVSQDYKDFLKSDILPTLSDAFIDNYKEQQKLATVKNKLIKDNIIKEDCK